MSQLNKKILIDLLGEQAGTKLYKLLDPCCEPPNLFWGLTGNEGTDPNVNFLGTTDAVNFIISSGAGVTICTNGFSQCPFSSDGQTTIVGSGDTYVQPDNATGITTINSSRIRFRQPVPSDPGLPPFADDAAAGVGGLTKGMLFQTSGTGAAPLNAAGIVMIKQ